ncbi:MAG: SpoIIE family protein phosphatase [Crocinitomicaceae bacterium]|nr:SpoIIE family protein phosphatase [Crocinitomicaceae bacterium]
MKKTILFLLICAVFQSANTQTRIPNKLVISGTVYGYKFDPSVKILNKETGALEGSVGGVTLSAYKGSTKLSSVKSGGNGTFTIEVPLEGDLKLEYSKDNYVTSSFNLDLSNVPADMMATGLIFENIELALNNFVSEKTDDKRPFGKLTYNVSTKALAFAEIAYTDKKKLFGDNKDNTPLNLMNKSVKKNLENNNTPAAVNTDVVVDPSGNQITKTQKTNSNQMITEEGVVVEEAAPAKKLSTLTKLNLDNITSSDLESRQAEIDNAWKQLEQDKLMAITPEDFAIIQAREELLVAAEKELEDAKKYIALQQDEIAAQSFKIMLLVLLLVVLAVSAFFIVRYARQKTILSKELAAKNKKITESIHYALRIQQSVLLTEAQVKTLLPDSFIFYKPLDIVSGDFYWISQVDSKIIVAVADCTGHGVPGAFMSLIGNTLLNHIVNEKKVTDAAAILDKLHEGIIHSLRQAESEKNNQDGMDLSLCVLDKNSGSLQFAGAMNPVYMVQSGEVVTLEPTLKAIGGIERRKKLAAIGFESQTIKLEKGTHVYLTSDGYMDQFGGPEQLKFNLPKFKELLLSLKNKSMADQKNAMDKALQDWKGSGKQIDDVLVVGFTV